jgi:hypothetical protein
MYWRVILSDKYWDQQKYVELWKKGHPQDRMLSQSKGNRHMKVCPQKGDHVAFVYKGAIAMRGIVVSDGFLNGTEHQRHVCNIGEDRVHASEPIYARIQITELCDYVNGPKVRRTGQSTWAKVEL